MREAYWTIYPEEWEAARGCVARLTEASHRMAFSAFVEHLHAGWQIIGALQVEADRIIHEGQRAPAVARDAAGFLECEPTDSFRWIVHTSLRALPGPDPTWTQAMCDVDGEAVEIVRQVRMLYLATAHPKFPPLFGAAIQDGYPRLVKWLRKLPSVLRPVDRLVAREIRGDPVPML